VENAALKFVALVLALTAFVLVHSDVNDVYHPWVSVTYSQEKERVMVSERVDKVQISVRGSRRRIKRLQKRRFESVHIDATRLSNGDLLLEPSMFDLPEGVELISVNPPSIHLEFDERDEKLLTVAVDTVGVPARGFKLDDVTSSPMQVRVSGARRALAAMSTISTEPVNLAGRTQPFEGAVALIAGDMEMLDSSSVSVSVQIVEGTERRELAAKTVGIRAAKGLEVDLSGFRVQPETALVTMYGSLHALESVDADKVQVFVELSANDVMQGAPLQLELKVEPGLSDIAYKIRPTHIVLKTVE